MSKELKFVKILDKDSNVIDSNNPLSTNGDSIYEKDIDQTISSSGTFEGDINSLFNDYGVEISDITATNPKTYTIRFTRPITSNKIGIGSLTGNFSNVKISLKDLTGTARQIIDDSDNSTKYTSNLYEFTIQSFIEVVVEFYTTDAVKISGMFIPKTQAISISSIDGIISTKNSTLTPLTASSVFTGGMEDTKNYGMLQVALYTDEAGTFEIQFRSTPTSTWRTGDTYTVAAGEDKVWSFQASRRFMRIVYTNGGTNQGVFDLQTILKPVYVKPSSHPIGEVVKANDDAELVKAQITGERPDADFGNVSITNGNNLKTSLEEYDPVFTSDPFPVRDPILSISRGLLTGIKHVNKFGAAINGLQILPTDIWDRSDSSATQRLWIAPTQTRLHTIQSSSSLDDGTPEAAGAGAQAVRVWGLISWDSSEVSEDVILNGTGSVNTSNSYVIIYRMKIISVGSTYNLNLGNITAVAAVDSTITAQISIAQGQTLMAIYGIPSTKKAYMPNFYFNLHDNANPGTPAEADFRILVNENPDLNETVFLIKHSGGVITSGNSNLEQPFIPYKEIEGPAIIKIQGTSSSADLYASAGFDLILVDN